MDVNSLLKTITRQHRGCDLNPGPSAPERGHIREVQRHVSVRYRATQMYTTYFPTQALNRSSRGCPQSQKFVVRQFGHG